MEKPVSSSQTLRNFAEFLRMGDASGEPELVELGRQGRRESSLSEFNARIDACALALQARGLCPGARVAILARNGIDFLIAYFAAMRAAMIPVPINYRLPTETVSFILEDARVSLAFVDSERQGLVPKGLTAIDLGSPTFSEMARSKTGGGALATAVAPDDICKILYTSGSTGRPKGVALTHGGQGWAIASSLATAQTHGERALIAAPFYHKNGLYFCTLALAGGARVFAMDEFDARRYLQAVEANRCTWISGIPTMFALMAREPDLLNDLDLSSVKKISVGSAPLSMPMYTAIARMFPQAQIVNGYGATEAGPLIFGAHPDGLASPPLTLGVPAPGIEWRLVGGQSADEGALELRTPAMMQGYLNLPAATAARLQDGWYKTGDLMRRDRDGFFYFVGRADDMFVCGGENVYPAEVESVLERHPAVAQAAVVSAPDDVKGAVPVAFVVLRAGADVSAENLKAFALANDAMFRHPRAVQVLEALPVGGTHKIDRLALSRRAAQLMQAIGRATPP